MGNALCFSMMNDEPHHVELEIPDRQLVATSKFHPNEPWNPWETETGNVQELDLQPTLFQQFMGEWGSLHQGLAPSKRWLALGELLFPRCPIDMIYIY